MIWRVIPKSRGFGIGTDNFQQSILLHLLKINSQLVALRSN